MNKYSDLNFLRRPVDITSPFLLNFILFLYFIIMPFWVADKSQEHYVALIVAFFGFASLNIGLLIKVRPMDNSVISDFSRAKMVDIFVIFFVGYDLLRFFDFLLNGASQVSYHQIYSKHGWGLYILLFWVMLGFLKYYCYSLILSRGRKIFWILFLISLCSASVGRARFELVSVVMFFVIFGVLNDYLRIRLYQLMVGLVVAPVFMLFLLIKRNIVGDFNFLQMWNLIFEKLKVLWGDSDMSRELLVSMEAPATFEIFTRVIEDKFVRPESGVIRIFFNFIPRELWPEKPLPMQIELARIYNPSGFEAGGGVFANIYGDSYANAGIFGVVLLPFLVGLLLNIAYKNASSPSSVNAVSVGFYAVLVVYFANFYRGYFSDMTWQVILLYVIFWLSNQFLGRFNGLGLKFFPDSKG